MIHFKSNRIARIFPVALLLLFIAAAVATVGKEQPSTTHSANPLRGRWQAISAGQRTIPRGFEVFWTFGETEITVTDNEGKVVTRDKYSVDLTTKPPTFTMKVAGEKDRIGWIRFKGNELQIVLTMNTGKPPKSWNDGMLLVFRPAPSSTRPARDP